MSARRAALRRERLQNAKAEKKKGITGDMERARVQGVIDGRAIAACVCLEVLHDKYKLSASKAEKVIEYSNKESTRYEEVGVNFVLNYYAEKFAKRIKDVKTCSAMTDVATQIYLVTRNNLFITGVAIMSSSLNEVLNYTCNNKNTGRLDYIMEYCANRFIEMQLDAEHKTVDYYYNKMVRKTGYTFLKR